ncbi:putative glycosyltransferase protein, partial [Corchorus olitorius]
MGKPSSFLLYKISEHRFPAAFKGFFYFLPISLALTTLLLIFIYITTTAYYVTNSHAQTTLYLETLATISPSNYSLDQTAVTTFPFDQTVENDDLVADPSSLATLARTSKWLDNLFGLTN